MQTATSHKQHLAPLSRVRRIHGQPGDLYEVIFVDQHDHIVVVLATWHIRSQKDGLRPLDHSFSLAQNSLEGQGDRFFW
jgi:hypothetical protein